MASGEVRNCDSLPTVMESPRFRMCRDLEAAVVNANR